MQIHRLFEIVYILMSRKTTTAGALASHFEVSKRTILRDVQVLAAAGIPVYTTQGKGGGISLMEQFVMNRSLLSAEEQNQILLSLQGLSATGQEDASALLAKLENLFDRAGTNWIEVDFSRWGHKRADQDRFNTLKHAILDERELVFTYVSSQGKKSARNVFPLKLVFKSKAWYLQSFCTGAQEYRTFKVNRMLNIEESDTTFERRNFVVPPLEEVSYPTTSCLVALELAFPPHMSYRVYDEFDDGVIEQDDRGWLRVATRLPEDNWLYGFLLSFGKDIEISCTPEFEERLQKQRELT